ncbi:MAG: carbon-nitrogen hydrolase family protein [Nannocystaceae bacterium]|nr:carbon-nitrogen hydrolase family protein [bacterium]
MTLFGLSLVAALWAADDAYDTSDPIVAAIAYTGNTAPDGSFECEEMANSDIEEELCEVEVLVRDAADQGAVLITVSEGAFETEEPEALPRRGRVPDPEHAPVLAGMSNLAAELGIYLLVPMHTIGPDGRLYTSLIALNPRGRAVGIHHKVELYSSERDDYAPGKGIETFETPWGRVAMMLCSDLYGEPSLHQTMVTRSGADIVALSSLWTTAGALSWQAALAHDWGVHVIAANGAGGDGVGSGIYTPEGRSLASDNSGLDTVVVATLQR